MDPDENLSSAEKRKRAGRLDIDVRGILAIISIVCAFALAFVQLFVSDNHSAEIPAWAAAIVAGVTGFYFGSRGGGQS